MELGHGRQGQTKQKGGLKTGKYHPVSKGMTTSVYLSDVECSHPLIRGTLTASVEGWLHTLH